VHELSEGRDLQAGATSVTPR